MSPPGWALELVARVCADAGVAPPRLRWRRRASQHSTGIARHEAGDVAVRAGTDDLDQRLTLLHELAHWLLPAPRRRRRRTIHHGRAFYALAFELYRRHGVPDADALRLESGRYRSALSHGAALGVPGARAALAAHREASRRPAGWEVVVPDHRIRLAREGRWTVCRVCGHRIVGTNLARIRRSRRPMWHAVMQAVG